VRRRYFNGREPTQPADDRGGECADPNFIRMRKYIHALDKSINRRPHRGITRLGRWVPGNTPDCRETGTNDGLVVAALLQLARTPEAMFTGAVTNDGNGAPVSASVTWPDGSMGVYSGTASGTWPGAVSAYTVTKVGTPTRTFTQPAVTRDTAGNITNRPAITVS
jgi:hypothetical protein